ncbi:MAG: hypothetical protein NZM25_04805 [Leptospiraceae bacterium]|nr:hypothetical protein [Leptospiraceae bacterium]MDW8305670.1 hypothetical protein [Leptospiraceae bacterium]
MKKTILPQLLLLISCAGKRPLLEEEGRVFYEKKEKEEMLARSLKGEIIYSRAKLITELGQKKTIYQRYVFQGADESQIYMAYMEFYGKAKEKPDLYEEKSFPYKNQVVEFEDVRLHLFKVAEKYLEYKIEKKPGS